MNGEVVSDASKAGNATREGFESVVGERELHDSLSKLGLVLAGKV